MKTIQKIGAAAIVGLFLIATPAYAATNDHTNYWAFDEATGASIGDTGGQNGVVTGTSSGLGWAGGKSGTALGMDGTAGTGVALPDGFLSGSQGTLSVWFKMSELSSRNIIFSGKSTTDNNIFVLLSVDYEGRPQLLFRTDPSGIDRKAQGSAVLNKNEWYHLVLVASGQSYVMYINGEALTISGENIGRWFPDFTNQTLSYRIGTSLANPLLGSFSGMLDEMRIYNRPLAKDEVTALYEEGNAGTPTVPLVLRPTLSFSISNDTVVAGGTVTLSWAATKVDTCKASDGWGDAVGLTGTRMFSKLMYDAAFTLTCSGKGGSIDRTVRVRVATSTTPITGGTITVTEVTPGNPAQSTGATPTVTFSRNLAFGSRGEDVKALQAYLISKGFLAAGLSSGYFGQLTKGALVKYQTSVGLPQTGFFGPMTRAKVSVM